MNPGDHIVSELTGEESAVESVQTGLCVHHETELDGRRRAEARAGRARLAQGHAASHLQQVHRHAGVGHVCLNVLLQILDAHLDNEARGWSEGRGRSREREYCEVTK